MAAQIPTSSVVVPSVSAMPPAVQRYAETGEPPSTFRRDLVTVTNQIPRWVYGGFALLSGWMAYKAYKTYKAETEGESGESQDTSPPET